MRAVGDEHQHVHHGPHFDILAWTADAIRKAQAAGKYLGRKPSASLKAGEAVALVMGGENVAATARVLGIGRASVYRALEAAGVPYREAHRGRL